MKDRLKIADLYLKWFIAGFFNFHLMVGGYIWAAENVDRTLKTINQNDHQAVILHLKNELKQNPDNIQARFLLGKTYLETSKFSLADKELSKAYSLDKDNPEIALEYAKILLAKNNYSNVKNMLAFELNDAEQESQRLAILAYVSIAEKDIPRAKKLFNKSLKIKDNNQAHIGLIKIELLKNNNIKASKLISKRLKINAQNEDLLLLKAILAKRNHNYQEALEIYDLILANNPDNFIVMLQRAEARIILKDYIGAQSDIEQVLKINEYHPQANYLLAQSKIYQHEFIAAKNLAQKVLDVSSQHYPSMLILGVADMSLGYYNQAEKYLVLYLSEYPDNINARNLLANIYLAQNNAEQAVVVLESIEDAAIQSNTEALITLGGAYLAAGEYTKGLKLLNKLKKLSPEQYKKLLLTNDQYIKAYVALVRIAEQKGDIKNVAVLLEQGYEQSQGDFKAQFTMAVLLSKWYLKQKQNKELIKLANELVSIYPDKTNAYSLQAQILIKTGHIEQAKKVLQKIISKNKKDIRHRLLLADILTKQGGLEQEVLQLLDEIIAIEPEISRIPALKSAYLIKLKKYSQALNIAYQLQQRFPEQNIGKQLEASVYLAQGVKAKALDNYLEAYQVHASSKLLSGIISLMLENSEQSRAIKLLQKEIDKNNSNTGAHFLLAKLYQDNKQYEQSIKHYLSILKQQSDNVVVMNNLAWVYLQQNNPRAIDYAKKAYKKWPQSAAIADTYGYILIKQSNKVKNGLSVLKKAVEALPEDNNIQFHLAEAYYHNGEQNKAVTILEKITQSDKNFSEYQQAIALLNKLKN